MMTYSEYLKARELDRLPADCATWAEFNARSAHFERPFPRVLWNGYTRLTVADAAASTEGLINTFADRLREEWQHRRLGQLLTYRNTEVHYPTFIDVIEDSDTAYTLQVTVYGTGRFRRPQKEFSARFDHRYHTSAEREDAKRYVRSMAEHYRQHMAVNPDYPEE